MSKAAQLSRARLFELLSYDSETGHFLWRVAGSSRAPIGSRAGTRTKIGGYRVITLDRVQHKAHRLAWFYSYGEWPSHQIDHENGNTDDNRLCNLRIATGAQNCQNQRRPRNNKSGAKGVSWDKKRLRWVASIMVNGSRHHLGHFQSIDDAADAYEIAARRMSGGFARPDRAIPLN
jgi:hypothetical protein